MRFKKQHRPQEQEPGQHGVIFGVEDPDLVEPGSQCNLQRRPVRHHPPRHDRMQDDHRRHGAGGQVCAEPDRQTAGHHNISRQPGHPGHRQRVRQVGQYENRNSRGHTPRSGLPQQRQGPETEPQAEIEIEETHVKYPAIGQHGDTRQNLPGLTARSHAREGKRAPNENQNCQRYGDALRRFRSEHLKKPAEHQVEQDVGGLPDDLQSLDAAAFDQLRQPGVVDVAGKIAGLRPAAANSTAPAGAAIPGRKASGSAEARPQRDAPLSAREAVAWREM